MLYVTASVMSLFSSFLNFLDDTLHIFRLVEYLVIDLRKRQGTVITECLQGAGRNVQIPAYVLIVHPLVQRPVVLPVANFHDPMLKVFMCPASERSSAAPSVRSVWSYWRQGSRSWGWLRRTTGGIWTCGEIGRAHV